MKGNKKSIKWKIFFYLLSFTAVLLVLLWLFQIVYLDKFYIAIKTHNLDKAMDVLVGNLEKKNPESVVEAVGENYGVCVLVTNRKGEPVYSSETVQECTIHKLSPKKRRNIYLECVKYGKRITVDAVNNIGIPTPVHSMMESAEDEEKKQMSDSIENDGEYVGEVQSPEKRHFWSGRNRKIVSMSYAEVITIDNEKYLVMANSILTPVDSTVYTLRVQIIFISVIMIMLSMLIALIMSKSVSKSIIKVNNSAKLLAKGDFNVEFDGADYKEISELSDTLNYAARELGRAEGFQRELIANVSHDLRTPLTMIIAYSEMMRDLPDENSSENIQVVIDEAKRLSNLVSDMLDMSKLQAGVIEKEIHEYNLTESIESVMTRYSKLKEQEGYTINFEYDEEIFVEADEYKIYQVIYNLINNAINYAGEDKTITVKQIVNGDKVRVEVIDKGEGISNEEIDYVWERYYKVDKTHKRAITGTGLGLSIVKNILKLHNADYGVESEKGKGSTFWFELKKL